MKENTINNDGKMNFVVKMITVYNDLKPDFIIKSSYVNN